MYDPDDPKVVDALQSILDFVEGRMSVLDFEQTLYNDSALECLLKDESLKWQNTYVKTDPYEFLINLNYSDPGDIFTAQGALEMFLQRKEIPYNRTTVYSDFYDLLMDVQPKWLLADPAYVKTHVLPEAGNRNGAELKEWLKTRIRELFRYHKRPPKWIQNPAWPINENGPMYFLGQIKIENCELFHDEAAAYLFLDLKTRATKSVIQVF